MKNIHHDTLTKIYNYNKDDNSFKLEVKIAKYDDLFNSFDPSPLRKRDLDQDFITYLEEFSNDIPLNYNIHLHIFIPEVKNEVAKEERIIIGIRAYYSFLILTNDRKMKTLKKQALLFISFAIISLYTSFFLNSILQGNNFSQIIIEGFNIGGWVLFWEALTILFFSLKKLKRKRKYFQRIVDAELTFDEY